MATHTDAPSPAATRRTRRVFLVRNRNAEADAALNAAIDEARARGHTIDIRTIDLPEDAERFAREGAAAGADTIVAAGGDGTLHGVLCGLPDETGEPRAAVGLVPFGTGNDFATACGIPIDDPQLAFQLAVETEPVPIDICRVNGHVFVNAASGGFGAEVTTDTPQGLKQVLGRFAYFLTGLAQVASITPNYARLTAPDFAWEGEIVGLAVSNGPQAGGGMRLAPKALLDDGLLDLLIIPSASLTEIGTLISDLIELRNEVNVEHVIYEQKPWVEVETREELQVNVDGEPIHGRKFRFELLHRRLKFHLLPTAPLSAR